MARARIRAAEVSSRWDLIEARWARAPEQRQKRVPSHGNPPIVVLLHLTLDEFEVAWQDWLVTLSTAGQRLLIMPMDATAIDEALSTRYTEHIQHLSQVENGTGSRIGLYFRVVGTHALGVIPSLYSCRLSHGVLVRFLRFRLCCHHLRIHTGRWQLPVLLRPQRTCLRCNSTAVDDEAHCLYLCEHPTILEARDVFMSTVVPAVSYLVVFSQVC